MDTEQSDFLAEPGAVLFTLEEQLKLVGENSMARFVERGSDKLLSGKTVQRALNGDGMGASAKARMPEALKASAMYFMRRTTGLQPPEREIPFIQRLKKIIDAEVISFRDSRFNNVECLADLHGPDKRVAKTAAARYVLKVNLSLLAGFDACLSQVLTTGAVGDAPMFARFFPRYPANGAPVVKLPLWWWLHDVRDSLGMQKVGFSNPDFATDILGVNSRGRPSLWMNTRNIKQLPDWTALQYIFTALHERLPGNNFDPDPARMLMIQGLIARALHHLVLLGERHGLPQTEILDLHDWYTGMVIAWGQFILDHLHGRASAGRSPLWGLCPADGG